MERGNESGKEGLEQFDKESLHSREEFVNVGELKDTLVCDLQRQVMMAICFRTDERTTKMSSRSFTNVHLRAYPSFSK